MTTAPAEGLDQAEDASDAMKDQLRKDVASWREGRTEGSGRGATELSVAVARSIVPPTTARMKRAKPVHRVLRLGERAHRQPAQSGQLGPVGRDPADHWQQIGAQRLQALWIQQGGSRAGQQHRI